MIGRILLILLGIVLLLILLVLVIPLGVDAGYEESVLFLRLKIGLFRYTLYPKKPRPKQKRKGKQKTGGKAAAKKKTDKGKKEDRRPETAEPEGTDETITVREKTRWDIDTIAALAGMGMNALRRFFRSFRVELLRIHYTVAASDPYAAALQYGRLCAVMEVLPGQSRRLRSRDIAIGCDFNRAWPEISARIVVTLQLYRLVFLPEYIVWKIRCRRAVRTAALTEREDDNGRQQDQ